MIKSTSFAKRDDVWAITLDAPQHLTLYPVVCTVGTTDLAADFVLDPIVETDLVDSGDLWVRCKDGLGQVEQVGIGLCLDGGEEQIQQRGRGCDRHRQLLKARASDVGLATTTLDGGIGADAALQVRGVVASTDEALSLYHGLSLLGIRRIAEQVPSDDGEVHRRIGTETNLVELGVVVRSERGIEFELRSVGQKRQCILCGQQPSGKLDRVRLVELVLVAERVGVEGDGGGG